MASSMSKNVLDLLSKENTVLVSVNDDKTLKCIDIIKLVEDQLGEDSVVAIVAGNGSYAVTLINDNLAHDLSRNGLTTDSGGLHCKRVDSNIKVVSFMHLPVYISDEDIEKKLYSWGVTPFSHITRKTIDYNGKKIYDGTRFLRVNFPPGVCSLPYATNFDGKSYSVRHNDQEKVCYTCLQPGHVVSDCPDFKCFRCKKQGHGKRACTSVLCPRCRLFDWECKCLSIADDLFSNEGVKHVSDCEDVVLRSDSVDKSDSLAVKDSGKSVDCEENPKVSDLGEKSLGQSEILNINISSCDDIVPDNGLNKPFDSTDSVSVNLGCDDDFASDTISSSAPVPDAKAGNVKVRKGKHVEPPTSDVTNNTKNCVRSDEEHMDEGECTPVDNFKLVNSKSKKKLSKLSSDKEGCELRLKRREISKKDQNLGKKISKSVQNAIKGDHRNKHE